MSLESQTKVPVSKPRDGSIVDSVFCSSNVKWVPGILGDLVVKSYVVVKRYT